MPKIDLYIILWERVTNILTSILSQLNDQVEIKLWWIPAHYGVHGNESVDILEKEGSGLDQHNKSVSCKDEIII